jgi:hypothetical protein
MVCRLSAEKSSPIVFFIIVPVQGMMPVNGTFGEKTAVRLIPPDRCTGVTGEKISLQGESLKGTARHPCPAPEFLKGYGFIIFFAEDRRDFLRLSEVFFSVISAYLSVPDRRSIIYQVPSGNHGGKRVPARPETTESQENRV